MEFLNGPFRSNYWKKCFGGMERLTIEGLFWIEITVLYLSTKIQYNTINRVINKYSK